MEWENAPFCLAWRLEIVAIADLEIPIPQFTLSAAAVGAASQLFLLLLIDRVITLSIARV